MGETILWLGILLPVCLLFSGLGIYAMKREKPMWFWSGTEVNAEDITDIRAYNRANGFLWLAFSLVFWISLVLGLHSRKAAGIVLFAGSIPGVILLPLVCTKIYDRYRREPER